MSPCTFEEITGFVSSTQGYSVQVHGYAFKQRACDCVRGTGWTVVGTEADGPVYEQITHRSHRGSGSKLSIDYTYVRFVFLRGLVSVLQKSAINMSTSDRSAASLASGRRGRSWAFISASHTVPSTSTSLLSGVFNSPMVWKISLFPCSSKNFTVVFV